MCTDSRKLPAMLPLHSYDKVLLDAPCSGLGTLKHKPEIKATITPKDIDDIVTLQGELLEAGALMVKNGGYLTYSTCTLNRKENDRQVASFLSQHPEFELVHEQTIFPYEGGSDGFYIANMHKSMLE
jgi:16S rRNA (cytosine967-C5)-methyltransferase